jgi:hypothetical protein
MLNLNSAHKILHDYAMPELFLVSNVLGTDQTHPGTKPKAKWAYFFLISKNLQPIRSTYRQRRSGRDCRNPEAKDGVLRTTSL